MSLPGFDERLDPAQREVFSRLDSPGEIQAFLDSTTYSPENANRCPLSVLRDRQAHCLDGALFAAAALRRLGYPPLLVDMLPEPGLDDDHVLAVFKQDGRFGAVAKSNFVGLRFREPVYRSLRELVMSYFDFYHNVDGVKSLRAYTPPLNLKSLDRYEWMWTDAGADAVERRLWELRRIPVIDAAAAAGLRRVDPLTYQANMLGVNEAGLFRPGDHNHEQNEFNE